MRKRSKFETCERHRWLDGERRYRRAEFFVEGGPADDVPGCRGGRCRLWPGTDLFDPSICTGAELELEWTTHVSFPNNEPKPVGAYVVNVHPCGHSDEEGVVIQADDGYGSLTARTGRGSTTYGPAVNWRPTDRRPAWLDRLELEPDGYEGFLEALAAARARLEAAA